MLRINRSIISLTTPFSDVLISFILAALLIIIETMQLLKQTRHPDAISCPASTVLRTATRAIVMRGEDILLLYTKRYDDYSLPGGGVNEGESLSDGLKRELAEETGASDIEILEEFGLYREWRPWHKAPYKTVQMDSYCYVCRIAETLAEPQFEAHEINNGMKALWINIHHAIAHNHHIIQHSDLKGLSIERETYLLELIASQLLKTGSA
ncbi:NUDIX hydrolase [Pseudoalteromonas ulvae]|uniref:NUDIX hydrolase n=1 Tax=Pseudoalteromonas ulvae TaxID=107327 RepID=UPI00267B4B7D